MGSVFGLRCYYTPQTHSAGKVMFDCIIISQVKSLSQDKWRSVVHHVRVDSEQKCVTPTGTTRMLKLCARNLDYRMVGTVQQPNHDYIALHCMFTLIIHAHSKCQVNCLQRRPSDSIL